MPAFVPVPQQLQIHIADQGLAGNDSAFAGRYERHAKAPSHASTTVLSQVTASMSAASSHRWPQCSQKPARRDNLMDKDLLIEKAQEESSSSLESSSSHDENSSEEGCCVVHF
ncbi:unnamed protein product [Symbiodinium sp. CCMP2592]|nr:unnamed protein product [Symbiodinium sp. CCMP2592]